MSKKKYPSYITVGGTIAIIILILNWPNLQIQTNEAGGLKPNSFNEITVRDDVVVWNKGGKILGGNFILEPNVCLIAKVSHNLSCKHRGYGSSSSCNIGICEHLEAGTISNKDYIMINVTEHRVKNFTIELLAEGYIGPLRVDTTKRTIWCNYKESEKAYRCN